MLLEENLPDSRTGALGVDLLEQSAQHRGPVHAPPSGGEQHVSYPPLDITEYRMGQATDRAIGFAMPGGHLPGFFPPEVL